MYRVKVQRSKSNYRMSFLTGPSRNTWEPIMTADTTTTSYWLNWRVLLCAIWLLVSTIIALVLICKKEGFKKSKGDNNNNGGEETQQEEAGALYEDETWRPCLKEIHPAWLLAFRVFAFFVLLILLVITACVDGAGIFYFYTQWTFTLITIYFGLGSLLSMRGCYRHYKKASSEKVDNVEVDTEKGKYVGKTSNTGKRLASQVENHGRQPAGILGYAFQIIFQMNAGAVVLTDCVFWFIIVPFLTIKDYDLNFLIINMHSINAVFLLGDTALNCMRFPWFRIGYFFMWTIVYVMVQWIAHACVKLWWPYPFLDLSSPYAPIWYLSVAFMHIPCYGIFALVVKLKHHVFSTYYPNSYQCVR